MLTVAIATENNDYDAEVYRVLLSMLLRQQVDRHKTDHKFSGWKSVRSYAEPYLKDAQSKGVRHALFAIDNDGGCGRAPEHESDHAQQAEAANEDGCRVCWLAEVLPAWWIASGGRRCIVVPVQVLETWLLCLRGSPPFTNANGLPERDFNRRVLKDRFLGKPPRPPPAICLQRALAEVQKPDALTILRQRRSFRHFEAQLADWT